MDDLQKAANEMAASPKTFDEKGTNFIVELIKEGKKPDFIVEKLVANGYNYNESYQAANHIYGRVMEVHEQKEKKNSTVDIVLGLVILVVGIGITVGSGHIIAYGAIIVGAIKLIRGIVNAAS